MSRRKERLCAGGQKDCCNLARPEGRRCSECEYQFSQTETQKRLASENTKASVAQIARQIEALGRADEFYLRE